MTMKSQENRYWAIRTDRDNKTLLLNELKQGRLRQGWGYDHKQDLRLIKKEIDKGDKWWERLSKAQRQVLPHHRMLSSFEDSVHINDRVVVPNLPENGSFIIVEVTGEYYFEPLQLSKNDDNNELVEDYGHTLPIRVLTDKGINKYADHVHADIRSTLRTPMRMWNLDRYSNELENILEKYEMGIDFSTPTTGQSRLETAWDNSLSKANQMLQEQLGSELDKRFRAAEWEEPIINALKKLYQSADVKGVGGPHEHGADIIVTIPNYFDALPWLIIIQVKNYVGVINTQVLDQLRTAYNKYGVDGKVLALVAMTTAVKASEDFAKAQEKLSTELDIPVSLVLRNNLLELMAEGFISNPRTL